LRVLVEIPEKSTERSTITCPICLGAQVIKGRTVRVFMDNNDDGMLDALGFKDEGKPRPS
jgi:hypothetical protein